MIKQQLVKSFRYAKKRFQKTFNAKSQCKSNFTFKFVNTQQVGMLVCARVSIVSVSWLLAKANTRTAVI